MYRSVENSEYGLYFSEIDTRGWPYRRRDLLLPFNHTFAQEITKVTSFRVFFSQHNFMVSLVTV